MKKNVSLPLYAVLLLGLGLAAALGLSLALIGKASPGPASLSGTYSKSTPGGVYLALDHAGHFCIYTQEDGLLQEGNYQESQDKLYTLQGVSGYAGSFILADGGLYLTDETGLTDFLPRIDSTPVFIGSWAEGWPHWPDGPYEIQP